MLGDGKSPLGDDTSESHHDRELSEVLILLSIEKRKEVCLLLSLDVEQGDDCEIVERTTSERIWGDFFTIDRENMGGL